MSYVINLLSFGVCSIANDLTNVTVVTVIKIGYFSNEVSPEREQLKPHGSANFYDIRLCITYAHNSLNLPHIQWKLSSPKTTVIAQLSRIRCTNRKWQIGDGAEISRVVSNTEAHVKTWIMHDLDHRELPYMVLEHPYIVQRHIFVRIRLNSFSSSFNQWISLPLWNGEENLQVSNSDFSDL